MIDCKFDDPGDKLVHMLQVWLKLFGPETTWSALARAPKAKTATAEKGMKRGFSYYKNQMVGGCDLKGAANGSGQFRGGVWIGFRKGIRFYF